MTLSLKLKLAIGAALLGIGAVIAAAVLYTGMNAVATRLDAAVAAEVRMSRYATLSTRASTFLVIATEAVQRGLPPEERIARIAPTEANIRETFALVGNDIAKAVADAEALGLDQQTRYATQSLGLARMEALLSSAITGLSRPDSNQPRLRAHIDSFASGFDPLLNQAVNTEALFRRATLESIQDIRRRITGAAFAIAAATLAAVLAFYFGLVRPQFSRLDRLQSAARQIAAEDFALSLPVTQRDEIGALYAETNTMARALSERKAEVDSEWGRLNETIAARTAELSAANARLAEIDENRRRFFADVSHELRTPLTVILMEAQLGQKGDGAAEAFATIEARAARLNRRIDDLLRVARSDSGQLALEPAPTPLAETARAVSAEVAAEIENAGMTLTADTMGEAVLLCDPNWARQIVVGLVRNAIRHAREGGRVHLSPVQGERAGIAVIDNGPGIPAEDQETIFDRFSQSGAAKELGFGIGLSLARWVVEAQGGTIALESPVSRDAAVGAAPGTKITILLPRASA